MPETIIYISLVISSLALIGILVLLIFNFKKSKTPVNDSLSKEDQQAIGEVKAKIDNIDRQVEKTVEIVMKGRVDLKKKFYDLCMK